MISSIADILALSHIFNAVSSSFIAMIGYLVTAWYYDLPISFVPMFGTAISVLLVSSAGFIINDIIDIDIDRINRPDRILAAGLISVPVAYALYVIYNVLGIAIAFLTSGTAVAAIAILVGAALFFYSFIFKRMLLIGHLTIGIMGAMLMPFGGLAAGHLLPSLYIAPVVILAFLAREILKTVPDVEGDRANQVRNIATLYGPDVALRIAKIVMLTTAGLLPFVALVWHLNLWFLVVVFAVIWPLSGYSILFGKSERLSAISKMLFLLVGVALLVGSIH